FLPLRYNPALQGRCEYMAFRTFGQLGASGNPISIEYIEKPGLGRIALVNFLLSLVTLTIYRFWAKTNVRRHIWSCVHINGEPLEYTGRGVALFLGALFVTAVLGVPAIAVFVAAMLWLGPEHPALIGIQYLFLLIVAIF